MDFLGLMIRDNLLKNEAGIRISSRKVLKDGQGNSLEWRVNHAGIVVEKNHCVDCKTGISLQKGTNVLERNTTGKNVDNLVDWNDDGIKT